MNKPTHWEAAHICSGRALLRLGEPDLEDNPELWASLWRRFGPELLRNFIKERPGERPEAWWQFSTSHLPPREEEESSAEYLHRVGALSDEEIEAIADRARALAAFNGIHLGDGHFIEPDEVIVCAMDHCELTPKELDILDHENSSANTGADDRFDP
jgi:hypothetical protein